MVYENVVKEGKAVDDGEIRDLLVEINEDSVVVCQRITNNQQYWIRYQPSEVVKLVFKYSPRHRMCFVA